MARCAAYFLAISCDGAHGAYRVLPVSSAVSFALLMPILLYPKGLLAAVSERRVSYLLDAYLQLGEEASDNIGFISMDCVALSQFPAETAR
jgi:hypothetical protein